ncbi:hypothetical protein BJ138DRAFT_853159 [Hygrophoropsis aurantiaca]|uniref:Uncharacterized protein n=1 Tax=Hygrophoropsis aurantiaca TaxID=72124 RepID=A0ACB7ZUJ6_9AGAM|nr:hypothetical protein BJ138DRAFT_853159 [Hygrophoropsis aurantiaca]
MDVEDILESQRSGHRILEVYECLWDKKSSCGLWVPGDRTQLGWHLQHWHGVKMGDRQEMQCLWEDSPERCGGLQQENIPRHIWTVHLSSARVQCSECSSTLSRPDAFQRHQTRQNTVCQRATGIRVPGRGHTVDVNAWPGLSQPHA